MKITLSELRTKDLATLAQRTINVAESGKYPVIKTHPLFTEVKIMYADYDLVYTKSTFSGKGTDVAEADRERDIAFRNLKNFLDSYRKMQLLPNYIMAEDLFNTFKRFDLTLDKMTYSSQTAELKKLLEELETIDNTQKVAALLLTSTFEDLKAKQTAFEYIFAEQAGANAELRTMKSASGIRKSLEKSLKSLLNIITAMRDVPDWKLLYSDINELVKAAKNSDKVSKEDIKIK